MTTEEDDNKIYNEKSHIVTPETGSISPEVRIIVDDVDESEGNTESSDNHVPKFGRRSKKDASVRNHSEASDSEQENFQEKPLKHQRSISSDTTDESEIDKDRSFVILKEPCKQNKWLKPSWYL